MVSDRLERIVVLSQHSSDSHSVVAGLHEDFGAVRSRPAAMPDPYRGIVVNRMTALDRGQQIVGLFTSSPRAPGAASEGLVEPGAFHSRAPQKDRERDRAPPDVRWGDPSRAAVPSSTGREAGRYDLAPGNSAPGGILTKEPLHALKQ